MPAGEEQPTTVHSDLVELKKRAFASRVERITHLADEAGGANESPLQCRRPIGLWRKARRLDGVWAMRFASMAGEVLQPFSANSFERSTCDRRQRRVGGAARQLHACRPSCPTRIARRRRPRAPRTYPMSCSRQLTMRCV